MSELKPCPFCGKEPAIDNNFAICVNDDCELSDYWSGLEDYSWNTRPIEDALHARIAELEAFIGKLIEAGEKMFTFVIAAAASYDEGMRIWDALVNDWKEREG